MYLTDEPEPPVDQIRLGLRNLKTGLEYFCNSLPASIIFFHGAPTCVKAHSDGGFSFIDTNSGRAGLYSGLAAQFGVYMALAERDWKIALIPIASNLFSAGCELYNRMIAPESDEDQQD